ncbi:TadE/TadG family type IV pilus assembly protein [Arthrobacter sp. 35W]|uniref:TadE/TadG family type IV pilus assembly protein n=1 Tax=Arthrobacter sp. 35W TaxID=1132441 RepID=UPI000422CEF4|nr:TadE/TadG family type IV pilus assembly protein [Arthrobacter sp. 35W]
MKRNGSERGAAAVEFALLLPVLLLLVIGIMEFGRAYNIQISASQAAREGARYAAVHYIDTGFTDAVAESTGLKAAPTLPSGTTAKATYKTSTNAAATKCASGNTVTVTVVHQLKWMTGYLPLDGPTITGVAVMQCGG